MDLTPEGLKRVEMLAKLARKLGVKRARVGDVELELGPAPLSARRTKEETEAPEADEDPLFDGVR